jgi:propanediol dehydratase small subunit
MTLKESIYQFRGIDPHSAIAIQMSIENRLMTITDKSNPAKKGEKELTAIAEELKQFYDDLDRHIAALVREEEFKELAKKG